MVFIVLCVLRFTGRELLTTVSATVAAWFLSSVGPSFGQDYVATDFPALMQIKLFAVLL
jgi:hypothetical protein